jgi:D-3-phosphoglycerate dehydrogenase
MKVLYLAQPTILQPWYDDVWRPCAGRHEVKLYDPKLPLDEQFKGVEVVVDQGGSAGTREQMLAAKRYGIRLWQVLGTGLDHVDIPYLKECGLVVSNTPGTFSAIALAEHALFLMLYLLKQHPVAQRNIAGGIRCVPLVNELHGQTLGLVGFGASGRELARRGAACGMRIVAIDVVAPARELLAELKTEYLGDAGQLELLLRQADIVSVHVPLLPSTRHLINEPALRAMKPNSLLINVARGEIIDEDALWRALSEGVIRGAGIDVFSREPVSPDHRLLKLENVVATPHIAGVTEGTSRRRGAAVIENLDRVANGLAPLYQVDCRCQNSISLV